MNYLELEETASTNTYATQHAGELADMTMVTARRQSAGRGQRGNSWESEPGRNLTFSLFFRPPRSLHPRSQFFISEAVALAIADALAGRGVEAMVKWPNDIYCGDRKICGILIEHSLFGDHIRRSARRWRRLSNADCRFSAVTRRVFTASICRGYGAATAVCILSAMSVPARR